MVVFSVKRLFSFLEVYQIELSYLLYLIIRSTVTLKYFYWHQRHHLVLSHFPKICYKCPALFTSSKTIYIRWSALDSPQFWSSYNGAENLIRKHSVNADWILISLSLISDVEMEVQGGVCVLLVAYSLGRIGGGVATHTVSIFLFVFKNSHRPCLGLSLAPPLYNWWACSRSKWRWLILTAIHLCYRLKQLLKAQKSIICKFLYIKDYLFFNK